MRLMRFAGVIVVAVALCVPACLFWGGSANADGGSGPMIRYRVEYAGSYALHVLVHQPGDPDYVDNETLNWDWRGEGPVPEVGNFIPLPSTLSESGTIDVSGGTTPSESCTLSSGTNASTPIPLSTDEYGLYVGYNLAIPGSAVTSIGNQQNCDVFGGEDALQCDQAGCAVGVCPANLPAVSSDRQQPAVMDAFTPQVPDDIYSGDWGSVTTNFSLPVAAGQLKTSCFNGVTETISLSISSSVTVDRIPSDGQFRIDFPDGSIPKLSKPAEIIPTKPKGPDAPKVDGPKTPGTVPPGVPVSGVIKIGCPKRDRRCQGAITAAASGVKPATVGKASFSIPGGTTGVTEVPLSATAQRALQKRKRLTVTLVVSTEALPSQQRFTSARTDTIALTQSPAA